MKTDIPIHLRWGDLDAYGHVNNVAIVRLLEDARTRVTWNADAQYEMNLSKFFSLTDNDKYLVVARQQIVYHAMMPYTPQPVIVTMWVGKIGGSSFEFHCQIRSSLPERTLFAQAIITIVLVNSETERPMRIEPDARAELSRWQDEPLVLDRAQS